MRDFKLPIESAREIVKVLFNEKKVLLICESTNSFIVKAIREGIEQEGFDCVTVPATLQALSAVVEKPDLVFLYIDENLNKSGEEVVYIRDFCLEDDKKLFLVGYHSDIDDVRKLMPDEIIAGTFERPIDAKAIGENLCKFLENYETSANKKHVLVVDDSGTMLRTIKEWLSGKYKVSIVNSATSALTFLATNHPDLVLLDYEMPVCSGPQMLEMIRSEAKTEKLPVIFLTSKGDKESVQKVLALKPDGYLLKSAPSEKIVGSIDSFFETQKAKKL